MKARTKLAALALVFALGSLLAGCGSGADGDGETAPPAAFTVVQPARSGSFFPGREGTYELILRGVGGAASIAAEGGEPGGAAGAIATSRLAREPEALLGPGPWAATVAGAEVLPQAFELQLSRPVYDGVRQELSFRADLVSGLPERPPPSFGAATLTIGSNLPSGSLEGAVTSAGSSTEAQGTPLGGALVEVRVGGKGLATAITDPGGSFAIGPLPDVEYELVASLPGYERDRLTATIAAETSLSLVPVGAE